MEQEELVEKIVKLAGGQENISRSNCNSQVMVFFIKDTSLVDLKEICKIAGEAEVTMNRRMLQVRVISGIQEKEKVKMSQYQEMAASILKAVGGKENVNEVLHCMTRLRFRLKDEELLDVEGIKKIPGVLGFQKNVGENQIIIGPKVDDVYQEVIKEGEFASTPVIKENYYQEAVKEKITFQKIGSKLFELISGCITPVIPAFVIMGMLNTIAAILGPGVLKILPANSNIYILLTGMASAVTYFLPFLLAFSASRKLGANTIVSLVMAAILMSPMITGAVASEEAFTVFGIPMTKIDYATTFLPIILIVAVQVYVEKILNKIIPDVLKAMIVPTFTVLVMAPLGLCVLGPIGQWLGTGLASVIMTLSEHAGFLEGALVAGLYPFLVAFGMGGPIFLATFAIYTQTGLDYLYFPYMAVYGMCIEGVVLAYILRSKSAEDRQMGVVALTSQALGAVSEPTIYGILFKNKICLAVTVIVSAIGGFYIGLTQTAMVNLTVSVPIVGPFLMFSGSSAVNMVNGCIGVAGAFILGFFGTFFCMRRRRKCENI